MRCIKIKRFLGFIGVLGALLTNVWAKEVRVYNQDGTLIGTYTTIQAGINACPEGGTVTVSAGVYNETIYINKGIALVGIGKNQQYAKIKD